MLPTACHISINFVYIYHVYDVHSKYNLDMPFRNGTILCILHYVNFPVDSWSNKPFLRRGTGGNLNFVLIQNKDDYPKKIIIIVVL